MSRSMVLFTTLVGLLLLAHGACAFAAEPMDGGKGFNKLTRGAINTVTGWVEIPKRIQETSGQSGAVAGFTWGLMRGLGYGLVRTAAGLYEVVTFPFPAPSGYEPLIQPEYVFSAEPAATK